MRTMAWTGVAALSGLLLFSACADSTGPEGAGQIQVLLTDAPADYIESAEVSISRVYLKGGQDEGEEGAEEGGEEEGAGFVDLFNDPENPLQFDLLDLQGEITANLTDPTEVEAGLYGQLRLVVKDALVRLKEGYEFAGGGTDKTLFVPSGMQSGIKVQLNGPIEIVEETLTIVTVDFDVNDNFVLQGNPETPAGIQGILFTPVLKEKGRTEEEAEG